MNFCVVTTFDCSFEEFKAGIAEFEDDMKKCLAEWEIAKMDDHKAEAFFEVTDMDAFKAIFATPKAADFHTKHNLVDTFYTLEKLS